MKVSLIISLLSPLSIVLASVLQSTDKEHQVSGQPDLINEALRLPQLTPRNKHQARNYSFNKLYKLQTTFLDAFIYPNNQAQAKSINSTIFSSDVQGRVDITRTFSGRELNTEYIFGLFANLAASSNNSNAFTLLGYPTSYEILHFAASQNIASASTRFNFTFPILPSHPISIIIDTWNVFNEKGQISMYDASFKYWPWAVDTLLSAAGKSLNMTEGQTNQFVQKKLVASICSTATKYCKDKDAQYHTPQQCEEYLTKNVRFGKAYELGRNTLLCRMVHQNMVPFRPSTHCPHIGPSGGGMCDDQMSYAGTVALDYFKNYPFSYSPDASVL